MNYTNEMIIGIINDYKRDLTMVELRDKWAPERKNIGTFSAEVGFFRKKLGIPNRKRKHIIDWDLIKERLYQKYE